MGNRNNNDSDTGADREKEEFIQEQRKYSIQHCQATEGDVLFGAKHVFFLALWAVLAAAALENAYTRKSISPCT